jgi:hypothetical protein
MTEYKGKKLFKPFVEKTFIEDDHYFIFIILRVMEEE